MRQLIICLMGVALFTFFISCQKEMSVEYGSPAKGSLQSSGGDCLPKSVAGIYLASKTLIDSNYIEVSVNVTTPGPYTIFTDSLNGYYFKGTGTFNSTGSNTVRLKGIGKPLAAGVDNFTVAFDTTLCDIAVTVLPAGTGAATFTTQCASFLPQGNYYKDTTLTLSNTISLQVNVATIGTYTITTNTVNGYSFSGSGSFSVPGNQTITLQGSGKPLATGSDNFIATGGTATCNFSVTVTMPTTGTTCSTPTIGGTYTAGTALVAANNTVSITHTYASSGPYTVTTNTVNGYSFTKTLTATGGSSTTIVLGGSGTPVSAGTNNFTIDFGDAGGTCPFSITVNAAAGGCTTPTVNGTYTAGAALTAGNTVVFTHTYTSAGPYTVSVAAVNGYSFGPQSFTATAGVNTITLTGTGTPVVGGTNNFTVNFGDGGPTCPFSVTVVAAPNNDYFPTTSNSYWTYKYDTGPTDTFKVTNAGPTQVFSGNTYQRFVYTNGASGQEYYRKNAAGAYYRSDDTAGYGALGFTFPSNSRLDILFLKNVLATGDSLISDFPCVADIGTGTPLTGVMRFKFKVINSNASISVNGNAFTNVYQLRAFIEFGVGSTFIDLTEPYFIDYYYAKGVGLIKWLDNDTPQPGFQDIRYWQVN